MGKYKAVVFDYDMTIADTAGIISTSLNDTSEHFGYGRRELEYVHSCIGNLAPIMLSHISGEKDVDKLAEMSAYYRKISAPRTLEGTTYFPYVREGVEILSEQGIKIGIVSLKLREMMEPPLARYGILPYITHIIGSGDVTKHKPEPEGLLQMVDRLGVDKADVLYVGDSLVDEKTAQNAGVDFVPMLLGATRREQFTKNLPGVFFNGFSDVCEFIETTNCNLLR